MKLARTSYTGRKARVGGICFDEDGRMQVFVNYCTGCKGKVLMSVEEARRFAAQHNAEQTAFYNKLILFVVGSRKAVTPPAQQPGQVSMESIKQELLRDITKAMANKQS